MYILYDQYIQIETDFTFLNGGICMYFGALIKENIFTFLALYTIAPKFWSHKYSDTYTLAHTY